MIDRTFLKQLSADLRAAVEGTFVELVGPAAVRVLVPNPRWAHDWVAITVELSEQGVTLSDAGELASLAGSDAAQFVELINCAGGELQLQDGIALTTIDEPSDVTQAVLSLAHYVIAAPVLWHARHCLQEDAADQEPSAVRELAKATKQRLTSRFGDNVGRLLRLNARVRDRGEQATAPMVMSTNQKAQPLLVSTFVDFEASPASIAAAKRQSAWVYDVARDLPAPKFIVANGSTGDVVHLAEFYDHLNVTALAFGDTTPLENTVEERARALGLPVG